jgi:hypothetical protein
VEQTSPAARDRVAARDAVVRLARAWELGAEEIRALVDVDRAEWDRWVTREDAEPGDGQLARIGELLAIYADLHALFAGDLADRWVSRPNTNALFEGRTPLQGMMEGGLPVIVAVRQLLDGRRYT